MKIDIKSTHLEMTAAIEEYINEKIGSLDRFTQAFARNDTKGGFGHEAVEAFVEIARTSAHHKHGPVFRAEVNLRVRGKVLRAAKEDWDIRVAIDAVKEELKMELQKEKGIHESKFKRGARILKRIRSISPLAWFKKEK